MRIVLPLLAGLVFSFTAQALTLDALSGKEAGGGMKEALIQGAGKAVETLGRTDGFLGNPKVRIPLPESLHKAEGMMRTLGMGRQADELVTAMNRAAEAAVPQAKTLLVGSIRQMSVQDAKDILGGGDDAATRYFRQTTEKPLAEKFQPIIKAAIARVGLARKYDQFAGKAAKFGLIREEDAALENYVTRKTLDGLYLMIAEEEKAIRQNPAQATGRLARKVFDLLR